MCKGHKNLCQNHLKELLYRQACVALWRYLFVFWVGVSKSTFHLSNAGDDIFYVIHGSLGHFCFVHGVSKGTCSPLNRTVLCLETDRG